MQLTIPIQFDEDKLREIVAEAVEKLKAEGYIWKDPQLMVLPDTPTVVGGNNGILGQQNCSSTRPCITKER